MPARGLSSCPQLSRSLPFPPISTQHPPVGLRYSWAAAAAARRNQHLHSSGLAGGGRSMQRSIGSDVEGQLQQGAGCLLLSQRPQAFGERLQVSRCRRRMKRQRGAAGHA